MTVINFNTVRPTHHSTQSAITYGHRFVLSAARYVDAIRFAGKDGAPFRLPDRASIYNVTAGALIVTYITADADWVDVGGGWWEYRPVDHEFTPPQLPAGDTLCVNVWQEGTGTCFHYVPSTPPAPDTGITYGDSRYAFSDTTNPTATIGEYGGVDLYLNSDPPEETAPPPPEPGSLEDWLDLETGTQVNSAPLDTNARLRTLIADAETRQAALLGILGNSASAGSITSPTTMGRLAWLIAAVNALPGLIETLGATVQLLSEWLDPEEEDPGIIVATIRYLQEQQGLDQLRRFSSLGADGWTLVDSLEFTGPFTFDAVADRYVLNLATWGSAREVNEVAGATTLYRAGWWCPKDGALLGERRFLTFSQEVLCVPAMRCQGVLVNVWPEATGTIQAWRYDGA